MENFTTKVREWFFNGEPCYDIDLYFKGVKINWITAHSKETIEEESRGLIKEYSDKILFDTVIDKGAYSTLLYVMKSFLDSDEISDSQMNECYYSIVGFNFYKFGGEIFNLNTFEHVFGKMFDPKKVFDQWIETINNLDRNYIPLEWVLSTSFDEKYPEVVKYMIEQEHVESYFDAVKRWLFYKNGSFDLFKREERGKIRLPMMPVIHIELTDDGIKSKSSIKQFCIETSNSYYSRFPDETGITFELDLDNMDEDEMTEVILNAIMENKEKLNSFYEYYEKESSSYKKKNGIKHSPNYGNILLRYSNNGKKRG